MTIVPKFILPLCCRDALNGPVVYRTYIFICNPAHKDGEMPAMNQHNL